MWRGGSLQAGVSVKLQPASAEGGRQLVETTLNPPGNKGVCNVNVVINVQGLLDGSHVQFLLDSGAALSVVRYETSDEGWQRKLTSIETLMLGANGHLLDVKGRIEILISPEPVKIYQGTRLGLFTPGHAICAICWVFSRQEHQPTTPKETEK